MATTEVSPNLIRRVLSEHEQALLRHVGRGKSLGAIAQLYRQYGGENGVREAIDGIRRKLHDANVRSGHGERPLAGALAEHAAGAVEDHGGLPVRTVAPARMNGAGAANGHAPSVPPAGAAPASSSRLPAVAESPARRSNTEVAAERDATIVRLLERRTATCAELAHEMDLEPNQLNSALARLRARGDVVVVETRQVGRARVPVYGRHASQLPATRAPKAPQRAPEPAVRASQPAPARQASPVDPVAEESLTRRYAEVLIIALEEGDLDEALMDRIERILGLAAPTPTD